LLRGVKKRNKAAASNENPETLPIIGLDGKIIGSITDPAVCAASKAGQHNQDRRHDVAIHLTAPGLVLRGSFRCHRGHQRSERVSATWFGASSSAAGDADSAGVANALTGTAILQKHSP